MDIEQITADLVGTSKAQRYRLAGRAVMRVLPLIATQQEERPFSFWPAARSEQYTHALFRVLVPSLTERVKPKLHSRSLSPILRNSKKKNHISQLVQAIVAVGECIEAKDYIDVCDASIRAIRYSSGVTASAWQLYSPASNKYSSGAEEKYAAVDNPRYGSTYTTAYSAFGRGAYSAQPSSTASSNQSEQIISDLSMAMRRDIHKIGSRAYHDQPLPAGLPLWNDVLMPSAMKECWGRMDEWLQAQGGDCSRWGEIYKSIVDGRL